MSIDSISPDQAGADPRSSYLAALSVAEQIVAAAPVVPQSIDTHSYGEWKFGRYGVSVHLLLPADVTAFARWVGAHASTSPRDDGRYTTAAVGEYHGVPFRAWALHSDVAWVKRQTEMAGQLAAQAHALYDLDADSAAVLPGCAPYGCLAMPTVDDADADAGPVPYALTQQAMAVLARSAADRLRGMLAPAPKAGA
ncbi:hypothetical protein O1L68_06010 [Streptomyces lydicus]|nr:hypothetical protein [Streptomyces lydicus]